MNIGIVIFLCWIVPAYIWALIWSIRIRRYVKKNNIKSLNSVFPKITYIKGELSGTQMLGEAAIYCAILYTGPFTILILTPKMVLGKKPWLPDNTNYK